MLESYTKRADQAVGEILDAWQNAGSVILLHGDQIVEIVDLTGLDGAEIWDLILKIQIGGFAFMVSTIFRKADQVFRVFEEIKKANEQEERDQEDDQELER